jgi:chemotaxis family two-component system sensor kinase Cph1
MDNSDIFVAPNVDLIDYCEREAIHIPGSVQPHGVLFVLSETEFRIVQVSKNTSQILGVPPKFFLKKPLSIFLESAPIENLNKALKKGNLQAINPVNLSLILPKATLEFDGIFHKIDGYIILEIEPSTHEDQKFSSFYHLIKTSASKIQETSTLDELCQTIVQEVRDLTGFDRVMVYRFDHNKNGDVIAEEKQENLQAFLGLHYPASDIPKQARELYCLNWLRFIVDINYTPVEIVPYLNPLNKKPTDLSLSVLRSVSPFHIEYLQNMGVAASMTISLMKNHELWGLIACHHYSPKFIPYEIRKACEFLGQVMSLELEAKVKQEDYEYRIELKSVNAKLVEYMSAQEDFVTGLLNFQPNLLNVVNAQGAAICMNGACSKIGNTPNQTDLKRLIEWLDQNFKSEIFYTDCLAKRYPEAISFKDVASGLMVISISQTQQQSVHQQYIMWFRPEEIHTVNWAGNPHSSVEENDEGHLRLSPRKSFELWKETVQLTSLPWKDCEIAAAQELKNLIVSIVLRKVNELAQLNLELQYSEAKERAKSAELAATLEELKQIQTQLVQSEKMSSLGQMVAGVAHEINNPVNFIYGNLCHADNYTSQLIDLLNLYIKYYPQAVSEISGFQEEIELDFLLEDLPKLLNSMKIGAERIRALVQSLRTFSRVDEAEMKAVNIHDGIDSTLLILSNRLKAKSDYSAIEVIKNYGNLPLVECYASQLNQVFMNVLANAIDALEERDKQRSHQENKEKPSQIVIQTALVEPSLEPHHHEAFFHSPASFIKIQIQDNGPGVPEEIRERLFDSFFTTKPAGKGTGIGLTISREIVVEKHGGNFTCISQLGQGTEFVIEIPLKQSSINPC